MRFFENRLWLSVWTATALSLLTVACGDELQLPDRNSAAEKCAVELKAAISQQASSRADESGFADGDRMGVFVV
ncbi:MAG: fimbrillin family protein, partial [Muribaculaceae bacterium]|nr:fimbrillin family protein [Muribaculaceae bacterium]